MNYLAALFFAAKSLVIGCPFGKSDCDACNALKFGIKKIGDLPPEVVESSGLAVFDDLFLTHPDSGNPPLLWSLKFPFDKGNPVSGKIDLEGLAANRDWEDLAQDDQGNLYIGDFGNNNQNRRDLCIYKYDLSSNQISKITFSYPDQTDFPPSKRKDQNYDCESMIWLKGNIYLFSKSRGSRQVKIYRLPDEPGSYKAEIVDTLNLAAQITAADVSPDGQLITLLAYGKVFMYQAACDKQGKLTLVPFICKRFTRSGQAEAIVFIDNEHLLITNEKGKVFFMYLKRDRINKRKFKPEPESVFQNRSRLK